MSYINSAIDKNRQMYQHLSNSANLSNKTQLLTHNKTHYYNDEDAIKKQKRKKISKWLTLGFAALASIGIICATIIQIARNKINPKSILDDSKEFIQNVSKDARLNESTNFALNLDAAKNDLWTSISEKLHLRNLDKAIREWYSKLCIFENQQKYEKGFSRIESFSQKLNLSTPQKYSDWFSEMSEEVGKSVNPEGRRINQVLFSGFKNKENKTFKQRIINGINTLWKNGTKNLIADKNIEEVYKKFTKGLPEDCLPKGVKLTDDLYSPIKETKEKAFKELVSQIQKLIEENSDEFFGENIKLDAEIYQKALKEASALEEGKKVVSQTTIKECYKKILARTIAQDYVDMNKILSQNAYETIAKQRDLHLGNASVDVLGMISSAGILSGAIITADTKEEKESIALDLGLPIISTMIASFLGGIKNISGLKSAIMGLAFSTVTSGIIKNIEKNIHKNKKEA